MQIQEGHGALVGESRPVLFPSALPFQLDGGLMELKGQGDLLRIFQRQATAPVVVGGALQAVHRDPGDLTEFRDPALKAVPVAVDAEGEEHDDGGQGDRSLPGGQHPEGLPQKHLRGEVAHQPPAEDPAHQGQAGEPG